MSDLSRYRAAPFEVCSARAGNRLLTTGSGERRILAEGQFILLDRLRAFRTIAEHDQRIGGRVSGQIEELRRSGLLLSEDEFLDQCIGGQAADDETPARISTIGIPTRARGPMLDRCIDSFRRSAAGAERPVRFVIADGDCQGLAASLTDAGADPELVRFSLTGDAPGLPAVIARRTGANRNALLLETAGEPFFSVDDDVICRFYPSPNSGEGLLIQGHSSPNEHWFDALRFPASELPEYDVWGSLERALGPAIQERCVLAQAEIEHSAIRRLVSGGARARIATVGLAGDAAAVSPLGWLASGGASRERLVESEAGFRRALTSRRIFSVSSREALSQSRQLMTYGVALDNRRLLPPFPPLGRDQDGLFGVWLSLADPRAFTRTLPFAVAHEPVEVRSFDENALTAPAPGIALIDAMRLFFDPPHFDPPHVNGIHTAEQVTPASMESGLAGLAERGEELVRLSGAELRRVLTQRRIAVLGQTIGYFERLLGEYGARPAWWARCVNGVIRAMEQSMVSPALLELAEPGGTVRPEDSVELFRIYAQWCCRLLRGWPEMNGLARQIRLKRG